MLIGAVIVLVTGQISPVDAAYSINLDVMIFLFGMFVVGDALHKSGYLSSVSSRVFSAAVTVDRLILLLLFFFGLLSAVLMNDTLAIIGTPLVLYYGRKFGISEKLLLLALCIAVTTGSVMSPIGNPQNLLVATGITESFPVFFTYLAIPTVISLLAAWVVLRVFYSGEFTKINLVYGEEPVTDPGLATIAKYSLGIVVILVLIRIANSFLHLWPDFPLPVIAIAAAAPILLASPRRFEILRNIDWATLVFFAAMFVLMASVFATGFFQSFIDVSGFSRIPVIITTSVVVSQFISNVPFVALFQPVLLSAGTPVTHVLALAAGATIAGNLTIIGAASNVIVIQNAEREGATLTFLEFLKVGLPMTVINILVYSAFLSL